MSGAVERRSHLHGNGISGEGHEGYSPGAPFQLECCGTRKSTSVMSGRMP